MGWSVFISVISDWIGENSVGIANVEVEDRVFQVSLKVNFPVESLYENGSVGLKPRLSPEMTTDVLKQRLTVEFDKVLDITLKGSFSFWQSTCAVPADCYFSFASPDSGFHQDGRT